MWPNCELRQLKWSQNADYSSVRVVETFTYVYVCGAGKSFVPRMTKDHLKPPVSGASTVADELANYISHL